MLLCLNVSAAKRMQYLVGITIIASFPLLYGDMNSTGATWMLLLFLLRSELLLLYTHRENKRTLLSMCTVKIGYVCVRVCFYVCCECACACECCVVYKRCEALLQYFYITVLKCRKWKIEI